VEEGLHRSVHMGSHERKSNVENRKFDVGGRERGK
jgi:hypothetical protein